MRFTIAQLDERAKVKPAGYREDVLAASTATEPGIVELTQEAYEALALKWKIPGFAEKLRNVMTAVAQLAADPTMRTSEEIGAVLTTCIKCPYVVEQGFRCGKCGCFLEVKAKARAWKCPEGKW